LTYRAFVLRIVILSSYQIRHWKPQRTCIEQGTEPKLAIEKQVNRLGILTWSTRSSQARRIPDNVASRRIAQFAYLRISFQTSRHDVPSVGLGIPF